MRRRSTRKQKGAGCGCGGMEMLGFPKTGGFLSLFGGQEEAVGTPPGSIGPSDSTGQVVSSEVIKKTSPQELFAKLRKQNSMESRQAIPESQPMLGNQPMINSGEQAMEPSRPKPRKPSMEFSEDSMSDESGMMKPKRPSKSKKSTSFERAAPFIDKELKTMRQDINDLKYQISRLQSSSGSSTTTSPGLFGGRRKTLRRMRKHRR